VWSVCHCSDRLYFLSGIYRKLSFRDPKFSISGAAEPAHCLISSSAGHNPRWIIFIAFRYYKVFPSRRALNPLSLGVCMYYSFPGDHKSALAHVLHYTIGMDRFSTNIDTMINDPFFCSALKREQKSLPLEMVLNFSSFALFFTCAAI
jgi:hypothetical protein